MLVGYMRVSSDSDRQTTDLQRDALLAAGIDERHLFEERSVCSVTANTRQDGIELLEIASRLHVRVSTVTYELDRAGDALADLAGDRVTGAAVLVNG